MTDYSERREMEDALRSAKEEAERASYAKDEFLAHMSHEIRTPLNAIIGLSNLLVHRNQEGSLSDDLQTVKFSADNLRMLVDDILDFSKIQAGKVEVEKTAVDLRLLLQNLENAHLLRAKEQKNTLELDVEDHVPGLILTDPLRLSQVINNLLSNAIKFTEKGVVRLNVRLFKRDGNKAWLDFEVKDTGCGIPKEKQGVIFEKFIQADISTVRMYGGTGLGLSITKLLLELMDSKIHLESEVDKGSTFYFTLPVEIASKEAVQEEEEEVLIDQGMVLEKLRLLIVEDSEVNRLVLQQFLDLWGEFEADEAANGEEAIGMTKKHTYDLILMDLRMPIMDGYRAAEAIKEDPDNANAQVPIIALTADTPGELKKRPQYQYFTDILTKPFEPEDLRTKILGASSRYRKAVTSSPEEIPNQEKPADRLPDPDLSKVVKLFHGNVEGINRLLRSTLSDFEVFMSEHSEAVQQRNISQLQAILHKRKPMLDLLGLPYVGEQLSQMRNVINIGVTDVKLEELRNDSDEILRLVVASLEEKLKQYTDQEVN